MGYLQARIGDFLSVGDTESMVQYQIIENLQIVAGLARLPISTVRIECDLAFFQADATNLGFVYIGGQNVTVGNGIEIPPTAAISITPVVPVYQADTQEGLGTLYPGMRKLKVGYRSRIVIDLSQIFHIASAANQLLRVAFMKAAR